MLTTKRQPIGEIVLLLVGLSCQSLAIRQSQVKSTSDARELLDHASSVPLERSNSSTRVLARCQMKCQVGRCWSDCRRNTKNDIRQKDKVFRIKRHAAIDDVTLTLRSLSVSSSSSQSLSPSSSPPSSPSFPPAPSSTPFPTTTFVAEDSFSGSDGAQLWIRSDLASDASPTGSPIRPTPIAPARRVAADYTMKVKFENGQFGELYGDLLFWVRSTKDWTNKTVRIHWASETCNMRVEFPHCSEPNSHQSSAFLAEAYKWNKYRFAEPLLFNARYWVRIEHGKEDSGFSFFITPGCFKVDKRDARRCLVELDFIPNKETPNPTLIIDVACVVYDGRGVDMSVDIRWKASQPVDRWNSSVFVSQLPNKEPFMIRQTDRQAMRLDLAVNRVYEISVSAQNMKYDVIYEPLIFNASVEKLKLDNPCPVAVVTASVRNETGDSSHGILLGALVFVSLSIAGVAYSLYPKLKGILRPKKKQKQRQVRESSPGSFRPLNNSEDKWEINPREVTLGVEIGHGAFGRVLTGFHGDKEVAIKVLKENVPGFYRDDLLNEISLMKGLGSHPNIITMIGACTVQEPIALIVEYMPFGNLQTFLRKCRLDREMEVPEKRGEMLYCLLDEMTGVKETWPISSTDILSFARQVVLAMQYLAEHHCVHRDLAARNVLLGNNKVVKICDFGLARSVYAGNQYFKLTSGRLPLKWMALESMKDRVFTSCSDVWSFGVLLWEMVTLGASPYPGIALVDLYRLLSEGYRMQQPFNCSDELYDIISQCWCENPTDRPTFARIRSQLETLLAKDVDYLDLDNIDIPLDHSEKNEDSSAKDRLLPAHSDIC